MGYHDVAHNNNGGMAYQTHDPNNYKRFLDDPLGSKAKQREELEKLKKANDPFIERIKLIEDTE